jgi:hypothetical protein
VTSKVRKSLAETVADELLVLLEPLAALAVALVAFVALAAVAEGVAELPERACTAVIA